MATLDKTATLSQPASSYQGDLPTTIQPPNFRGEKPPSHFPIAIFTLLGTCNCLFGFLAILFSALSDKAWDNGDRNTAKMRGTIAFVLGLLGTAISFAIAIIVLLAWAAAPITFNVPVGAVALVCSPTSPPIFLSTPSSALQSRISSTSISSSSKIKGLHTKCQKKMLFFFLFLVLLLE